MTQPCRVAGGIRRTGLMERPTGNAGPLVSLDVRRPDHLAPLLDFIGNELAEGGRRKHKWSAPKIGKPRLDLGIGETRIDLLVELVNDLSGCVLRCGNSE